MTEICEKCGVEYPDKFGNIIHCNTICPKPDDAMIERVAIAIAWDCFHLGVKSLSGLDAIARAAIAAMQPKAEG